jgi:hypothetical protein
MEKESFELQYEVHILFVVIICHIYITFHLQKTTIQDKLTVIQRSIDSEREIQRLEAASLNNQLSAANKRFDLEVAKKSNSNRMLLKAVMGHVVKNTRLSVSMHQTFSTALGVNSRIIKQLQDIGHSSFSVLNAKEFVDEHGKDWKQKMFLADVLPLAHFLDQQVRIVKENSDSMIVSNANLNSRVGDYFKQLIAQGVEHKDQSIAMGKSSEIQQKLQSNADSLTAERDAIQRENEANKTEIVRLNKALVAEQNKARNALRRAAIQQNKQAVAEISAKKTLERNLSLEILDEVSPDDSKGSPVHGSPKHGKRCSRDVHKIVPNCRLQV